MANLGDVDNRVTVDSLQTAVGYEYLRTPALHLADGGQDLIAKQRGFQFVNPTDDWFPGEAMFHSSLSCLMLNKSFIFIIVLLNFHDGCTLEMKLYLEK